MSRTWSDNADPALQRRLSAAVAQGVTVTVGEYMVLANSVGNILVLKDNAVVQVLRSASEAMDYVIKELNNGPV